MAGEVNDEMSDMVHRALDQIEAMNAKLANVSKERDAWKSSAERAEAFIAEFAAFTFTEAPRPHIRDPQDEPDEYVDAQEVWLWQSDAKDLLK